MLERRVKVRVSALGVSATELCRRTEIMSAANFSRAIRSDNPNLTTLVSIAQVLGMPSAWLLWDEGWAEAACDLDTYPAPVGDTTS